MQLPPLSTLRLFEAAGRRLSFREAAAELHEAGHRGAALGAARFRFGDLCVQPLGALDFLKIAREYHRDWSKQMMNDNR